MSSPILEIIDVAQRFRVRSGSARGLRAFSGWGGDRRVVHALSGVNLTLSRGEVLGLVGESGCGKSTLGRIAALVNEPSEGRVRFDGQDVHADPRRSREAQLRTQLIFQDPFASLNPRRRIREIISEAPIHHGLIERAQADEYVDEQLARVEMPPDAKRRYPHEFSGGQRQRICIARALAVRPQILVCDESVSALDVSVQAQILNLFMDLRASLSLSYLFISHDLSVIRHLSDRVAVMYLGRIVEEAPAAELFAHPRHPYTRMLLAGLPTIGARRRRFQRATGEPPSPLDPPAGCSFHPRCSFATERCRVEAPSLRYVGSRHVSACHLEPDDLPSAADTVNERRS